jgi:phospholipase C
MLTDFPDNNYHLKIYGPNGFFREFKGNADDPLISMSCEYEKDKLTPKKLSGNIILSLINSDTRVLEIEVTDNAYKSGKQSAKLAVNGSKNSKQLIPINLIKNYGWYDFTIRIKGNSSFEKRYAGHIETGRPSKSDPFMGRVI